MPGGEACMRRSGSGCNGCGAAKRGGRAWTGSSGSSPAPAYPPAPFDRPATPHTLPPMPTNAPPSPHPPSNIPQHSPPSLGCLPAAPHLPRRLRQLHIPPPSSHLQRPQQQALLHLERPRHGLTHARHLLHSGGAGGVAAAGACACGTCVRYVCACCHCLERVGTRQRSLGRAGRRSRSRLGRAGGGSMAAHLECGSGLLQPPHTLQQRLGSPRQHSHVKNVCRGRVGGGGGSASARAHVCVWWGGVA